MTTPADIAYRNYLATTPDRNESAAGYAMWNAAVEACAKMMEASVIGLEVHTFNFAGHAKFITTLAVSDLIRARAAAIRSLMTPKGPAEQEVMKSATSESSENSTEGYSQVKGSQDDQTAVLESPELNRARDLGRRVVKRRLATRETKPQPTVANDTAGAAPSSELSRALRTIMKPGFGETTQSAPPPGEGEIEAAALADRISKAKSLVIWETVYSPYNLHTAYVDQREPLSDRDFNLIITALRRLTQPQNAAAGEDGK